MADVSLKELETMRHSLAHIMAAAVKNLWPKVKFGVGPIIENGFYYDIDPGEMTISEEDFPKIEAEMRKIIDKNCDFKMKKVAIDEAIKWAEDNNQIYKKELLNDLKRSGTTSVKDMDIEELGLPSNGDRVSEVTLYTIGEFTDLCRGPHVKDTKDIGAFKLMRIAGAYWRGKENNPQMQRLYGVAFATQKELDDYLAMFEEAKKRDHRKLGQELDLFVFSDLVGPGLPLWTPRGTVLRRQLDIFVQELRNEYGFEEVSIPHITKKELYVKSGHWDKFNDELFKITTREGHEFALKPMNCPHHTQIYNSQPRSYRDLPIRYRETTACYRDEQSGELNGLMRVRAFTQDDAHIFCRYNQVKQEMLNVWDVVEQFYSAFDMKLKLRLSTHDPKDMSAFMGDEKTWNSIENDLKSIVQERAGNNYDLGEGEAAFYGPKLDFMTQDALGRTWQVATIQLDFNQPEGFDLFCTNEKGEHERILMVHCAIMGSLERFLSMFIEHTAGKFPVWLAPEQIRIATVNQTEKIVKFAKDLAEQASKLGLRVGVDDGNESVGKKIRNAETIKLPYTLVIGEKELETGTTIPRMRSDLVVQEPSLIKIDNFLKTVANEAKSRTTHTTM
ncbi:MAG TPA: threonine--tRNA ligase [Patescibacteria group bacterium]|nr:threonine--tRNA ligase [Patescibacteria group bacterium]